MLIFLLIFLASQKADAVPISTGTITEPTIAHIILGMQARNGCSDVRSMYDILRSCLFTLAACVYRAVHPNIPNPEFGFWRRLRVTIKITFCALIAPELIIYWALCQWFGAKQAAKRINEAVEMTNPKPGFKWTQTHGQFLQMGGFARKDNRKTLTSEALMHLISGGVVDIEDLQITEKEINDKSKGDALSKGLVAFQTMWFMFECIARLQQGLLLLEIEVVTLAFATLNAITYALWWYKPLNVLCPIYIRIRPEPSSPSLDLSPMGMTNVRIQTPSPPEPDMTTTSPEDQRILARVWGILGATAAVVHGLFYDALEAVEDQIDDLGWWLPVWWLIVQPGMALYKLILLPIAELFLGNNSFSSEGAGSEGDELVMPLAALIGMVFGAIHFLSWDSTFPTHTQLILWRASSIVLVVQPLFLLIWILVATAMDRVPKDSWANKITNFFQVIFGLLSLFLGTVPYILARICVLVLALLTLRDLPLAAFTNITWTSYIPHV